MPNASCSNEVDYDAEHDVFIGEDGEWYRDEECTEPVND